MEFAAEEIQCIDERSQRKRRSLLDSLDVGYTVMRLLKAFRYCKISTDGQLQHFSTLNHTVHEVHYLSPGDYPKLDHCKVSHVSQSNSSINIIIQCCAEIFVLASCIYGAASF